MGRWTDMDDDEQRLPEGMQRIGYDADTQRYTFRDADGILYESAPGARYGDLVRVGEESTPAEHDYNVEEARWHNERITNDYWGSMRMFMPFALLVLVFLLIVFKVVDGGFGGSGTTWAGGEGQEVLKCREGSTQVHVAEGDTCWAIAQRHGLKTAELLALEGNGKVDCDRLQVGQGICVPTTL